MRNDEIYRKVSCRRAKGVHINRTMCFYNTRDVLAALKENEQVTSWLKFISNHYMPDRRDILLIYPCSADKPYYRSRSYVQLNKTLSKLGDNRRRIHVATISEPFGLVPEEFYRKRTAWHNWKDDWYDCPGLFEWWCNKFGQQYSPEEADECISILADKIALFLKKVNRKKRYKKIVAFVRTYSSNLEKTRDQTHRRILEQAVKQAHVDVQILPTRRLVAQIARNGREFAWDMYGVSHPCAQEYLLKKMRATLRDN
jgi:archaeosine synthase